MRNYEELFCELQDLQKTVCYIKAWGCEIIETEDGFRFKKLEPDCYIQTVGLHSDEYIIDAFVDFEDFKVDKPGFYEVEAILSYSEEERGEYGRIECPAYLMIEHIELKYQCSVEEMNALNEESKDSTPLFDL